MTSIYFIKTMSGRSFVFGSDGGPKRLLKDLQELEIREWDIAEFQHIETGWDCTKCLDDGCPECPKYD